MAHTKAPPPQLQHLLLQRACRMRHAATPSESMLWGRLRRHGLGVHFRRQHPVGGYIADFACLSHRLIVEVDGAHHDGERDAARDAWFARAGFRVVRVKAFMVERHISVVLGVIRAALA